MKNHTKITFFVYHCGVMHCTTVSGSLQSLQTAANPPPPPRSPARLAASCLRYSKGLALAALLLLALGLAACGGDEAAAVVPPPAPPPAPPPFVPQAVEVALGSSGDTLTLMTAQGGGYTLNGQAFASGTDVTAEANGSTYTLTLDGAAWSAVYKMPEATSLALGATGGTLSVERLEDGSYRANGSPLANGAVVTAANGNRYTVRISDDGSFSAQYVVPPALNIPLGSSGSALDIVQNEDGTFAAIIGGETVVITAETRVTAANGNVYRALLSPDGTPVGAAHVSAMQEVMLGELGGTIELTQAEDMSWWLGETEVKDGYVHTAANGNMYVLTMEEHDGHVHWAATYQQVMLTVALGTQGSVELVRAEDMSWWLGSEAVDAGSEVMADNGNTYTLWYADGAWSARFEPESMMIEGTGLIAMTREGDDMYDVDGATLPASGVGDVTVDGAMYHVWMEGGALMGTRFDKAIDPDTDHYVTNELGIPRLSANDPDTTANELRAYLVATGNSEAGEGMFSMSDLLGSGMASDEGTRFVDEAVETIEKVRVDVAALLALDSKPSTLEAILDGQWSKLNLALDEIFGTDSDAASPTFAIDRTTAPREEDILDEIEDILDALSSEASFVAATADGGGGVFASQALGSGAAADAFNRLAWTASATLGMTGSTRYGTAIRKMSANAKSSPITEDYGAFSYSTMQQTVRTADAAAVSPTGIASYLGGTRAIDGKGNTYAGTMELQVRFTANSVSGVVSGLQDADGLPWQHNFADVDRVVLDDATLRRNAQWNNSAGRDAAVFYTADSGLLRPVYNITNTFAGILLGQGADAGSEANGTWSVGAEGGAGYLTGGFGVEHVSNAVRPAPTGGGVSAATTGAFLSTTGGEVSIADGMLAVKVRSYGWAGRDGTTAPTYRLLRDDNDTPGDTSDDTDILVTAKFDLAELASLGGAHKTVSGPKWVDGVVAALKQERDLLSSLQGLNSADTQPAELAAWQRVQDAVQYRLFGGLLPVKLDVTYGSLASEADAIDLINRALDALSSNAKLEAALDPDGTGIFDHYQTDADDDNITATAADEDFGNFRYYDSGDRRNEIVSNSPFQITTDNPADSGEQARRKNGRTVGNFRGEREYKVIAAMGTTDFTRFGIWRTENTSSARRNDGQGGGNVINDATGPNWFAYSALDPTNAGTPANTGFPQGGTARYVGKTIALQNTTLLTGTVRVDVSWAADADSTTPGTFDSSVGTMFLTVSDLASAAGDPLTQDGSGTAPGNEIADLVMGAFNIIVGPDGSPNPGQLVIGAYLPIVTTSSFLAETQTTRVRFSSSSLPDATHASSAAAEGFFVGQGVEGPLGVIGRWSLTGAVFGRLSPDGTHADDLGEGILGSFGAEAP